MKKFKTFLKLNLKKSTILFPSKQRFAVNKVAKKYIYLKILSKADFVFTFRSISIVLIASSAVSHTGRSFCRRLYVLFFYNEKRLKIHFSFGKLSRYECLCIIETFLLKCLFYSQQRRTKNKLHVRCLLYSR